MSVFFEHGEDALLTIVDACVILTPMTVENAASAAFLLAIFAQEGGSIEGLQQLLKSHLGEERYAQAFQKMSDVVRQYINNRTMELPEGQ